MAKFWSEIPNFNRFSSCRQRMKSNSHFLQNVSKPSTASYMACAVWCGIGCQELDCNFEIMLKVIPYFIYTQGLFVSWLVNTPAVCKVYLRDGSAWTISCVATLVACNNMCCGIILYYLQLKVIISSSHSILAPPQSVLVLTLQLLACGRTATRVPVFKSPVRLYWGQQGLIPDLSFWRQIADHLATGAVCTQGTASLA